MKKVVVELCGVLGLKLESKEWNVEHGAQVQTLIDEREAARKRKDFARADQIRKELEGRGIILEDTSYGTKWKSLT
jgi:cysteinyl-tRNA synthetase